MQYSECPNTDNSLKPRKWYTPVSKLLHVDTGTLTSSFIYKSNNCQRSVIMSMWHNPCWICSGLPKVSMSKNYFYKIILVGCQQNWKQGASVLPLSFLLYLLQIRQKLAGLPNLAWPPKTCGSRWGWLSRLPLLPVKREQLWKPILSSQREAGQVGKPFPDISVQCDAWHSCLCWANDFNYPFAWGTDPGP